MTVGSLAERLSRVIDTRRVESAFRQRRWRIGLGIALGVVLLVVVASFLVDEPLRRRMEGDLNARLDGYSVRIGGLDFHPLGFGLTLTDLTIIQQAHPDPPVAFIPKLDASVQWRELLRATIVANVRIAGPELHVDRAHLQKEAEDDVPVTGRGWQKALQAIYPLEVNEFRLDDGRLTYVERQDAAPLQLREVNLIARNIRNTRSDDRVYPSGVRLEARVFEEGRLWLDGHADFLATPHAGVLAEVRLEHITLDYFKPVLDRYHVTLRSGVLTARGDVEYAPKMKAVHLTDVAVGGLDLDYLFEGKAAAAPAERVARTAAAKARESVNDPETTLRIDHLEIGNARVGFVNKAATPHYRVFLTDTALTLENVSNHFSEGVARARLRGKFMGSGATTASATFRADSPPDFDLAAKIEDTDLRTMNDLLRAYGKFDVVKGRFSLYSEVTVKGEQVTGYVKPLFSDLDVYDKRQDADKTAVRKLYERVVGGISKLLENRTPREEVATKTTIQGPTGDVKANIGEVIIRLIQNAFFQAILPGFDETLSRRR